MRTVHTSHRAVAVVRRPPAPTEDGTTAMASELSGASMQASHWTAVAIVLIASSMLSQTAYPRDDAILDLVDSLRGGEQLTPQYVEKLAGCRLQLDADVSTGYFDVYRGACTHPVVASAELRTPTRSASARDGLVILYLRQPPCVRLEAVVSRYGEGEPGFPSPNAPAEEPMYLRYIDAGQRMSLGFQRQDPSCLSRVVVDRTER